MIKLVGHWSDFIYIHNMQIKQIYYYIFLYQWWSSKHLCWISLVHIHWIWIELCEGDLCSGYVIYVLCFPLYTYPSYSKRVHESSYIVLLLLLASFDKLLLFFSFFPFLYGVALFGFLEQEFLRRGCPSCPATLCIFTCLRLSLSWAGLPPKWLLHISIYGRFVFSPWKRVTNPVWDQVPHYCLVNRNSTLIRDLVHMSPTQRGDKYVYD